MLASGPSGAGLGNSVWSPVTDFVGFVRPGSNFVVFSSRFVGFVGFWPLWSRPGERRLGSRD